MILRSSQGKDGGDMVDDENENMEDENDDVDDENGVIDNNVDDNRNNEKDEKVEELTVFSDRSYRDEVGDILDITNIEESLEEKNEDSLDIMEEPGVDESLNNDMEELIGDYSNLHLNPNIDSFNITTGDSKEDDTYDDLLHSYKNLYDKLLKIEKEAGEKEKYYQEKENESNDKKEELVKKLTSMEKLLQDEMDKSDKDNIFAVRERKELNERIRDLEQNLVEKNRDKLCLRLSYDTMLISKDNKIKEAENKTEERKMENNEVRQKLEMVNSEFHLAKEKIEGLEEEIRKHQDEFKQLEGVNREKRKRENSELKQQLEMVESECHLAKVKISLLEEETQRLQDELVKSKNYVKEIKQSEGNEKLEIRIKNIEGEIFQIKQQQQNNKQRQQQSQPLGQQELRPSYNLREVPSTHKGNLSQVNSIEQEFNVKTSNRYQTLRFNGQNDGREEISTESSSDDNDITPEVNFRKSRRAKKIKVVPGEKLYSEATLGNKSVHSGEKPYQIVHSGEKPYQTESFNTHTSTSEPKENCIFSTSVIRDIDQNIFNSYCGDEDHTNFIRFDDKEVKYFIENIPLHLKNGKMKHVILLAGGNDLPGEQMEVSPVTKIADNLITAASLIKINGAESVAIASIPPRRSFHYQLHRKELNDRLKLLCNENGIGFVNNENIILSKHGHKEGIHLNLLGSNLLQSNLLNFLLNHQQQPVNSVDVKSRLTNKKTLILSDSMCGRIKVDELNSHLNDNVAYKKFFPGATPLEMLHYCTYTLKESKPETVIIHSGTNSLKTDDVDTIAANVLKIANKCKEYGVRNIFISGMVYRHIYQRKVDQFNQFFLARRNFRPDFKFISNNNINYDDICYDTVHLKYKGVVKLANNFINAVNGVQST